ncbi:MAG: PQQ-like beta-propeller repeat protein [Planctomycetales bacterium]|nr:PQQ-like beta-propeller repeat protein [Planctomycetales bacterium]
MRLSTCLVAIFLASSVEILVADDWPQWRGTNRDAVWHEDGLVQHLPTGKLPAVWSVEVGPGYTGPTVANGRVYVMDRQVDQEQTERILCFDSQTGQPLWQHQYEAKYEIGYKAGPRASVTIADGHAYAVGAMGHFHCLDAKTGNLVWSHDLDDEYEIEMPAWGIAASPLVYGKLVIQQVGGPNACFVAFDRSSGQSVWQALNERPSYSSPIIIQQAGQDVLVCWSGESLSGLEPDTGKTLWTHAMPPINMPIGVGTPVVNDDLIFVSSFYDGSLMIRAPKDNMTSQLVWRAVGKNEESTGSNTVMLASGMHEDGAVYGVHSMIGTPIIQDGYIYCVDSYGQFRCLDAATGRRIWEDNTAVPHNRWATIHMVQQADRTWMFNDSGELMIAQLSPQGLNITDRSQLIEPTKIQLPRRNGVCWSHPAFAERSVFIRNDERLIRVSLAK